MGQTRDLIEKIKNLPVDTVQELLDLLNLVNDAQDDIDLHVLDFENPHKVIQNLNTGVTFGGESSINGTFNDRFDLTAGEGVIENWDVPSDPIETKLTWPEFLSNELPFIASKLFTIVWIVESGVPGVGEIFLSNEISLPLERRSMIRLQTIVHTDFATITSFGTSAKPSYLIVEALLDYVLKLGTINTGNAVDANGITNQLVKAIGDSTLPFINWLLDKSSPTIKTNPSQATIDYTSSRRNGSGGFIFVAGNTEVDHDSWDDNNLIIDSVGNNKYTIKRVIFFGVNEGVNIPFGQAEYNSIGDAKAAIETEGPVLSSLLNAGVWIASIVCKKGVTDLQAAITAGDAEIIQREGFTSGSVGVVGNFVTIDTVQTIVGKKIFDDVDRIDQDFVDMGNQSGAVVLDMSVSWIKLTVAGAITGYTLNNSPLATKGRNVKISIKNGGAFTHTWVLSGVIPKKNEDDSDYQISTVLDEIVNFWLSWTGTAWEISKDEREISGL